jgi:hypothetical protein
VRASTAEEDKDQTAGDSNKKYVVTCESFARFLKVFGPLRSTILAEFDEICKRGYARASPDPPPSPAVMNAHTLAH